MMKKRFDIVEKMLRSEASSEELQELADSLQDDAFTSELNDYYRQKWDMAAGTVPDALREEMLLNLREQISDQLPSRSYIHRLAPIYKSAAAVLLPLVLVYGAYRWWNSAPAPTLASPAESVVTVENGQKAGVKLPDGTRVWLNSGTVLSYSHDYNHTDRVVKLKGEAYFEVAKDKTRPFIVKTRALNVRALGTAFDVKAYPNEQQTTTTLIEGKVKVYNPSFSTQMNPNQKVVVDGKLRKMTQTRVDDAGLACMWKQNQLAFDSETLGEIAVVLERSYNIDIDFESEKIKNIRFSGLIKNNSLESVLQLIALAAPVRYTLEQSKVTFRPAKEKHDQKTISLE